MVELQVPVNANGSAALDSLGEAFIGANAHEVANGAWIDSTLVLSEDGCDAMSGVEAIRAAIRGKHIGGESDFGLLGWD
jgi:hypothetical protein